METLSKYFISHKWLLHLAGWLTLICIEIGYLVLSHFHLDPWYSYLAFYCLNISLFYAQTELLEFSFAKRSQLVTGILLFILMVLIYLSVKTYLNHILFKQGFYTGKVFLYASLYRATFFLTLATISWFAARMTTVIFQMKITEKEKAISEIHLREKLQQTEVAYLSQRLNPHLLFNTLNSIYSKVRKQSKPAAEDILLLSDIMQYSSVAPDDDGKVLFKDELTQIVNLVALNEHRFKDNLNLEVSFDQANPADRIPPLLLLSLAENLFKHGDLLDPKHPASLTIQINDGILRFRSRNLKRQNQLPIKGSRLGIEQAKIRLAYYYPDRHRLTVNNGEEYFTIELEVEL